MRPINKRIVLFFVIFGFWPSILSAQQKPNVIIIIGDDISYNDFECYGHPVIKTPNIDKLARNGIRFNNAFLTTSSCSPSRTSIILGRYPHNTGAAELHSDIPKGQIAFPRTLKEVGYYTAQAGKWHFGSAFPKRGDAMEGVFDRTGGSSSDGGGASGAEKWVQYLQQRPREKPFFMWFAAHDAHRPWDNQFVPIKYKAEQVVPPALVNSERTKEDLASYYNEVSRFDFYIGTVVKELEDQGILQNTIIIIMADNGRPFPGNKTRMYDEGIKTPFIIHWPQGIGKNGAVSNSLLSVIDIAPTILELAGVKAASCFQGRSFSKVLQHPDKKFRNYVFAEHNWHDFRAFERMVRTEKFLYIENGLPDLDNRGAADVMEGGSGAELQKAFLENSLSTFQKKIFITPQPQYELYNCMADTLQMNNLSGRNKYKKKQVELAKILKAWQNETDDSQPQDLTEDWYDRISLKPLINKGKRGATPGSDRNATHNNHPGPF
ncbi:sulfatase [Pedobacter heparinus]|uniref:sulfatase family protein n=1 Tax=Pedobacter heparinus TaxID=984 RepID=UPI00292D8EDC|nr:sulfatase [Pedobacter heparinus]